MLKTLQKILIVYLILGIFLKNFIASDFNKQRKVSHMVQEGTNVSSCNFFSLHEDIIAYLSLLRWQGTQIKTLAFIVINTCNTCMFSHSGCK
jgi:hypothetical protein